MTQKTIDAFQRLNEILDTLRKECPWDRVQTLGSLRYLTIEEVYELSEAVLAIENSDSTTDKPANSQLPIKEGTGRPIHASAFLFQDS